MPVCIKVRACVAAAWLELRCGVAAASTLSHCSATLLFTQNLDTRPRSFRIKTPATRWFSLRGIGSQHRLAPGLAVTFEVRGHRGRSTYRQLPSTTTVHS